MDDRPITPHAGPTLDAEGRLTYIGDDGLRYVVALPPELTEVEAETETEMEREEER